MPGPLQMTHRVSGLFRLGGKIEKERSMTPAGGRRPVHNSYGSDISGAGLLVVPLPNALIPENSIQ